MEGDWESSFEFVSGTGQVRKRGKQPVADKVTAEMVAPSHAEILNKAAEREAMKGAVKGKKSKKRLDAEKILYELLTIFAFITAAVLLCAADLIAISFSNNFLKTASPTKQERAVVKSLHTDDSFKARVVDFMSEVKLNGRADRAPKNKDGVALFYVLSEREPIETAFRREWVADPSFFDGVDKFVRGMEWENTFEEDLFVRGVPNFDFKFELEEMTLKTTLNGKDYNHKFLNLGRKEMIDKNHSVEYFISARTLIRLERKHGIEVARTEYFLKHGDLYIFDKRGSLECTRVYYAPVVSDAILKKINTQ